MRLAALSALILLTGCLPRPTPDYWEKQAASARSLAEQEQENEDRKAVDALTSARTLANTGTSEGAKRFVEALWAAFERGTLSRRKLEVPTLVAEAVGYLDAASVKEADRAELLTLKGAVLMTIQDDMTGAKAALEEAFKPPSYWPIRRLLAIYDKEGRPERVVSVCKTGRPTAKTDDERFTLLDACVTHAHAPSVERALAWAPKGDIAFYRAVLAKREEAAEAAKRQEEAARAAARERAEARSSASNATMSKGTPSTSNSGPVSVRIRSRCSRTVRVFYGTKPKFGSGVTSRVSSNEVTSRTFQPNDMMWLVDDSDNGLSGVTVSSSTREITVTPDCRGLMAQ